MLPFKWGRLSFTFPKSLARMDNNIQCALNVIQEAHWRK
jgi:hypothetical protein